MAIVAESLALRAREHLTETDESLEFSVERLYALIPSALSLWAERIKDDPKRRIAFLATTGNITITNGKADVKPALDAVGIQPHLVGEAEIIIDYDGDPDLPVQFVNSRARLTLGGIQDRFFINAYYDGKEMYFRDPNPASANPTGTFSGTMQIRAVAIPTSLADVAASLEGELATTLAEIARKFNAQQRHSGKVMSMQKER